MTRDQKLLVLAIYLDSLEVKKGEFNLAGIWQSTCQTTKDPIGYATQIPQLKEQGFELIWRKDETGVEKFLPHYQGWHGWVAVTTFFEISYLQALNLFYYKNYPKDKTSPADVANKVRVFLRLEKNPRTRNYIFSETNPYG